MDVKKLLTHFTKKLFFCLILFLLNTNNQAIAQGDSSGFKFKPYALGFDYHLQINHLDISPQLYILQYKNIEGLVGLHTLYYFNNTDRQGKLSYGAGATVRYFFNKNIYTQVSYQYLNIPIWQVLDMTYTRAMKADIFAGIGYRQEFSKHWHAQLTAMYNVNYKDYSPYESKVLLKAGFVYKLK